MYSALNLRLVAHSGIQRSRNEFIIIIKTRLQEVKTLGGGEDPVAGDPPREKKVTPISHAVSSPS